MRKRHLGLVILLSVLLTACGSTAPDAGTEAFEKAVRTFYVGLSAMQVGDEQRAKVELEELVELAPAEPAAWANLGILQMRQRDLENAATSLSKASDLAPENVQLLRNRFALETQKGDRPKAIEYLKKAIDLDQSDLKVRFALAKELEQQNNEADAFEAYRSVLAIKPDNLAAQIEVARLAAKRGDTENVKAILASISPKITGWETEIQQQFRVLGDAANSGNLRDVSQNLAFFRNTLLRLPEFRAAIAEVRFDENTVGEPFMRPLKLPVPDFSPAAPDTALKMTPQPVSDRPATWAKAVFTDGDANALIAWADANEVHIGERAISVAGSKDVLAIDLDYNLRNDFVIVGESGLRFIDDKFGDITSRAGIAAELLRGKYDRAYAFDVEADGDLDIVLGSDSGAAVVLRNNADGTFQEMKLFSEVIGLRDLASDDLDEDGDADLAAIDAKGQLLVFTNERGGQFSLRSTPITSPVKTIAVADSNGDSRLDLNVLGTDGSVTSLTDENSGQSWGARSLLPAGAATGAGIVFEDFDNNGAADVLVGDQLWLFGAMGVVSTEAIRIDGSAAKNTADLNGDGRLDLVGLTNDGKPAQFINSGPKNYGWQIIRPRAAKTDGDQRINSFGIGSEIEIRAGLLAQKRVSSSPQVHFGLGEQTNVDVMRIVWGNGYVQADFDMKPSQTVLVEQRLKGSCPHLFAWNGSKFEYVKDAPPWSPALGLKINAQDTFGIVETEEWFKIPGEKLVAKDGFYELRITGEYWETFYLDHYSLLAVDHPTDREVFTDERFAVPPVELKVTTTEPTRAFLTATGNTGQDVSDFVSTVDENYLDDFDRGPFQGAASDHFVEVALPEDAPTDKKLWLVGDGWVHPTDASINVELGQSSHPVPRSLSIEIPDKDGTWKTANDGLGFPAGKMKTILIELPIGERRFRLRTNMEIFWDRLSWTADLPADQTIETRMSLASAELRQRGFSVMNKRDASSPEIPDYDAIFTTTQKWRDLEGYYTRYGDVLDLLTIVDDRYIISGAGDELVLKFPELPPVQPGWTRDFVIIGDGWIKDGDLNSVFSKTVLPLPTHATNDYSRRPTRLEDDPVYRQHSADWQQFHTRYVAPDRFRNALRSK
ncbi:MAG: FG-GAP-like repeat-containing protein [Pyrinomonadaceae bacterium]